MFKTAPLSALPIQIIDGDRGKNYPKQTEFRNSGYCLFLSAKNITKHGFDISETQWISKERDSLLNKGKLNRQDVILTTRGTVGNVGWYKRSIQPENIRINSGMVILRTDDSKFSSAYLYQVLKSSYFAQKIETMVSGSAQPQLPIRDLQQIEIPAPNLSYQRMIAYILGTIDDKIELNQKMNQTLEDVAQAIFKSWFIDFDPVRAKVEGRPTRLRDEISDLFPDEFIDIESSLIPKGWTLGSFGDVIQPKRGKVITKSLVEDGIVPVVAGGISPAYFHNKFNAESPVVTISASGTAGYVNIYYENIWASDCSYINKNFTNYVYFSYLFLKHNQEVIYHKRHGAVQQHIYPKDLMELPLTISSNHLFSEFENLVTPFFEKIRLNSEENNLLKKIRDIILPKLISGELQIPDAEKFLEEVGI